MREIVEPELVERYGHEQEEHPAFALIGVSRYQSGPPGHVLFDSDIQHHHYVMVTIQTAVRQRDLKHDRIFADKQVIQVAMSESQWASFVSSMGIGNGVPCTLESRGYESVPGLPHSPRMQQSLDEVRRAGEEALAEVREAFEKVKEKPNKGNIRNLEIKLSHVGPNMEFAAKSLNEHAENTVNKVRADIEAFAIRTAEQLGLDPAELGAQAALPETTEER